VKRCLIREMRCRFAVVDDVRIFEFAVWTDGRE